MFNTPGTAHANTIRDRNANPAADLRRRAACHYPAQKRWFAFPANPVTGDLHQVGVRKVSSALRTR